MRASLSLASLIVATIACLLIATSASADIDPQSGLEIAPGWEETRGNCTACHSAKLVIQNRMNREGWLKTIRWMQSKHNLWQLGDQEPAILDYLGEHYSARSIIQQRRRNLDLSGFPRTPE